MDRRSRWVWCWAGVFVSLGLLGLVVTAHAAGKTPAPLGVERQAAVPPRGSVAPAFVLESVGGEQVELAQFAGRPVVLLFGDLQHEGARKASREMLKVLEDHRLRGLEIVPIFLTAEATRPEKMQELLSAGGFPPIVLHDPRREAFGAYKILVVPSVVVVDGQGIVVHAMPGFLPRFSELLTQSLLVSTGQMTAEAFEASLAASNGKAAIDPNELRAERLVHLGEKLLGHKMDEMAEAKFLEAVELSPGYVPARLALGDFYRRRGELDKAEAQCGAIVKADPESVVGRLALARVWIARGGDSLNQAEATVRGVLERQPETARAHYLLGLIFEARGDVSAAAGSYRTAAELLLDHE